VSLRPDARGSALVLGLAAVVLVAGCGADPDSSGNDATSSPTPFSAAPVTSPSAAPAESSPGQSAPPDAATPADQIPDAALQLGEFSKLSSLPGGYEMIAGAAMLAQTVNGTTLTVRLTGLHPGGSYVGHIHARTCEDQEGGPHFQFQIGGSDQPPNEVHVPFVADQTGSADATTTNERQVGDGGRSVVIHPADSTPVRLVCADFDGSP